MSAKQTGEFVFNLTNRPLTTPELWYNSADGMVKSYKAQAANSTNSCFEGCNRYGDPSTDKPFAKVNINNTIRLMRLARAI
jgi:hypothetical protein